MVKVGQNYGAFLTLFASISFVIFLGVPKAVSSSNPPPVATPCVQPYGPVGMPDPLEVSPYGPGKDPVGSPVITTPYDGPPFHGPIFGDDPFNQYYAGPAPGKDPLGQPVVVLDHPVGPPPDPYGILKNLNESPSDD